MWKLIDYHEKEHATQKRHIKPELINNYFTNIFQAENLKENPTIEYIEVDEYFLYNISLDKDFSCKGLNMAILQIGRGIGLDSIDKNIARLFPIQLRIALLDFFNSVFRLVYPNEWQHQILRREGKKGRTPEKAKLRGIAVSSLLPTLYDIMLDNRFKCWYKQVFC